MGEKALYIEKADAIATIVIDRPDKRNAFTLDMWKTLTSLLAELEADEATKVVVIRGVDDTAFA
ncbi:enoyl-CoA hydratase/isomerase family protein, partial [Paenibacillus chitinolyticus]